LHIFSFSIYFRIKIRSVDRFLKYNGSFLFFFLIFLSSLCYTNKHKEKERRRERLLSLMEVRTKRKTKNYLKVLRCILHTHVQKYIFKLDYDIINSIIYYIYYCWFLFASIFYASISYLLLIVFFNYKIDFLFLIIVLLILEINIFVVYLIISQVRFNRSGQSRCVGRISMNFHLIIFLQL
jgi:hypothetical protein